VREGCARLLNFVDALAPHREGVVLLPFRRRSLGEQYGPCVAQVPNNSEVPGSGSSLDRTPNRRAVQIPEGFVDSFAVNQPRQVQDSTIADHVSRESGGSPSCRLRTGRHNATAKSRRRLVQTSAECH
jgi:hypothetical protein